MDGNINNEYDFYILFNKKSQHLENLHNSNYFQITNVGYYKIIHGQKIHPKCKIHQLILMLQNCIDMVLDPRYNLT